MILSNSTGSIKIEVPRDVVMRIGTNKTCTSNIDRERLEGGLNTRLTTLDPAAVLTALREYGEWDDDQLADTDFNLNRLLWILCELAVYRDVGETE